MRSMPVYDALVVGGGPAGCSAAFFLARAGLKAGLLDAGKSPLLKARQVLDFPARPDAPSGERLLADLLRQAQAFGVDIHRGYGLDVEDAGGVFVIDLEGGGRIEAERLLLATGEDLRLAGLLGLEKEGKAVATDWQGRTSYPGVYAAGRLRGLWPSFAGASAGDGVWVAAALVSDLRGEAYLPYEL